MGSNHDSIQELVRLTAAGAVLLLLLWPACAGAQSWDLPGAWAKGVSESAREALKITGEVRGRHERRTGQAFGAFPDLDVSLWRTRVSVSYQPRPWLKLGGAVQDSRAPGYGGVAPATARNAADLYEGYVELSETGPRGLSFSAGRRVLNYGDGKLISTPNWGNVSRTFDHARLRYRTDSADYDFLFVSPVKPRTGGWDRPVLGDRMWGVYNSFRSERSGERFEIYFLRREQNRPGGFTAGHCAEGAGRSAINSAGGRWNGPAGKGVRVNVEATVQTGKVGAARHRAWSWNGSLSRQWPLMGKPLETTFEYKYGSGTKDPADASRSGTYDQLYFSGHDRFGHMDLFGWRNLHNVRAHWNWAVNKRLSLNWMYNSWWLASRRDALYNGASRPIARSPNGAAGRHVGQEVDVFGVYTRKPFSFGVGGGRVICGEFLRNATAGVGPLYLYLFHTYSF